VVVSLLCGRSLVDFAQLRSVKRFVDWLQSVRTRTLNISSILSTYFLLRQVGIGLSGGSEAVIHATRLAIQSTPSNYVVAKLDFSNAFSSLHSDTLLDAMYDKIPELYKFYHLSHISPLILFFGSHQILSQVCTKQGDPLGPLRYLYRCSAVANLVVVTCFYRLYGQFYSWWP
jgi:hypothetical protein